MKKVYTLRVIEDEFGDIEYLIDTPDGYEVYPESMDDLVEQGLGAVIFVPTHQRMLELLEAIEEEASKPDVVAPEITDRTSVSITPPPASDAIDELQHLMYCYAPTNDDN